MILILTIVAALPLGLLIRNRLAAYLAYAVAYAQVYTFQTGLLVMEWANGSTAAFPRNGSTQLLEPASGYLIFTSVIYAAGFGLVTIGHWLRHRRRSATTTEVRLDAPTV
jgi:hypothetical protein